MSLLEQAEFNGEKALLEMPPLLMVFLMLFATLPGASEKRLHEVMRPTTNDRAVVWVKMVSTHRTADVVRGCALFAATKT